MNRYVIYFENGTNVSIVADKFRRSNGYIYIVKDEDAIAFFNLEKIVGMKIDTVEDTSKY